MHPPPPKAPNKDFHFFGMVHGGVLIDQTEIVLYYMKNRWRLKFSGF
jgi:hypothetical protein